MSKMLERIKNSGYIFVVGQGQILKIERDRFNNRVPYNLYLCTISDKKTKKVEYEGFFDEAGLDELLSDYDYIPLTIENIKTKLFYN